MTESFDLLSAPDWCVFLGKFRCKTAEMTRNMVRVIRHRAEVLLSGSFNQPHEVLWALAIYLFVAARGDTTDRNSYRHCESMDGA